MTESEKSTVHEHSSVQLLSLKPFKPERASPGRPSELTTGQYKNTYIKQYYNSRWTVALGIKSVSIIKLNSLLRRAFFHRAITDIKYKSKYYSVYGGQKEVMQPAFNGTIIESNLKVLPTSGK